MSRRQLVFCYGTLKRGFSNHSVLEDSVCLGSGITLDTFDMLNVGNMFPALAFNPSGDPVEGEVYSVDQETLAALDRLEGCPRHYARKRVQVELNDKAWCGWAWVYYYKDPARSSWHKKICRDHDGVLRWL
jgi:gamma-glutamylcyclotransferase (GGCT)/AIG2-like uncharacterized protein YtfP